MDDRAYRHVLHAERRKEWSALRARAESHTGTDEHRAHELLAEAGPQGALVLVRCKDYETRQMVATASAGSAEGSWAGSLTAFLAALDAGSAHDWVRVAVGEPSSTNR